jgi:hypothetical protein
VLALVLLTILPPAAFGRDPAVDQYVESVPRAGGDRPVESEPPSGSPAPQEEVRQQILDSGGEDAPALEAVTTSPALGAPEAPQRGTGKAPQRGTAKARQRGTAKARQRGTAKTHSPRAAAPGTPSAFEAASSAASGDGSARGWLLGGLALLSLVLASAAIGRRRLRLN